MNGIKIFMSHNFSSTVRTRASTLHIAPLPESGKISDFGNPSFVLINWDCLRTDYWKFDQTLWASRLGNCIRIPLNNQTLKKYLNFFIFLLLVFTPSPAPLLKRPSKDAALVSKATVIAFTKLGWLLIPRNFLFLLK